MKKTILVAVMLLSGVASLSAVQAAPDFGLSGPTITAAAPPAVLGNSREMAMADATPAIPPVPANDTTPAAGHFMLLPKAHIRLQNVAEFSNVRRPAFLTRVGFVKLPNDPEIAALEHHDGPGAAFRPLQRTAEAHNTGRKDSAECRVLDHRLDRQHLPSTVEHNRLRHAGCGSEDRAAI